MKLWADFPPKTSMENMECTALLHYYAKCAYGDEFLAAQRPLAYRQDEEAGSFTACFSWQTGILFDGEV